MEKRLHVFAVSNKHSEVHSPDKLFLQFLKRLEGNAFNVLPLLRYISFWGALCLDTAWPTLSLFSMPPSTRLQVQYRNIPITMKSLLVGRCFAGRGLLYSDMVLPWTWISMGQEVYCWEFFLLSLFPEPTGKPSSLCMVETLHDRGHVAAAYLKAKRKARVKCST